MKKVLFTLLLFMAPMSLIEAQDQEQGVLLDLEISFGDNSGTHNPLPKAPARIPHVYQKGLELTFATPCDGYTLQLINDESEVEYSIIIPTGANTLSLPIYLTGEYIIEITRGNFCFWGYISL